MIVMGDVMSRTASSFFRFLKGGLWLPIVLPFFLYKLIFSWHLRSAKRIKLQDKVVLITGASSGLGEALAHAFYNAGCKVILAARRIEELERVKGALLSSNPHVVCHHPVVFPLDISDLKTIPKKAAEAIAIHGTIDILVNNSGVSSRSDALSTQLDVDLKLMVVNYFGHIALTKAILKPMIDNGSGHIVAISSIQGRFAIPYRSSYTASKHALVAFFDTLRAEVHNKDVHVTVVSPGYIRTNLSLNALKGNGAEHKVMDKTTASGMAPAAAAEKILSAIIRGDNELILAPITHKIALYLRVLCPNLFFYIMQRRALKEQKND